MNYVEPNTLLNFHSDSTCLQICLMGIHYAILSIEFAGEKDK